MAYIGRVYINPNFITMAELKGIQFLGSLGTLSAYKRKDSDKTFLRGKGGASKEKILNDPTLYNIRDNNAEFGGRSKAGKGIRKALEDIGHLADHNISASLNTLLRKIQLADSVGLKGERIIGLSKHASLLQGFSFNRKHPFDSVVRIPVQCNLDKDAFSARFIIPELLPGINLFIPNKSPLFQFKVTIGVVPDCVYLKENKLYDLPDPTKSCLGNGAYIETEWCPSSIGCNRQELELKLPKPIAASVYTIVVGIGIQYGTLGAGAVIEPVKDAGSAKVISTLGVY